MVLDVDRHHPRLADARVDDDIGITDAARAMTRIRATSRRAAVATVMMMVVMVVMMMVVMVVMIVVVMVTIVVVRTAAGRTAIAPPATTTRLGRGEHVTEQVGTGRPSSVRVERANDSLDGIAEIGCQTLERRSSIVAWGVESPPGATVAGSSSHRRSSLLFSPDRGPWTMTKARSVS
jgi:hypothetical protein